MLTPIRFLFCLGLTWFFLSVAGGAEEVDFVTQVQPILNRRCAQCHGEKRREGGLRFTSRRDALSELDSGGHAIIAGAPGDGSLLSRLTSSDESERMPPEGQPLTAAEVELIQRWIVEGAKWPDTAGSRHWAYVAPRRPVLPTVPGERSLRNEIDHFVGHRASQAGLSQAPEEPAARLLRRLSLALRGIPPTVEELDAYLADNRDDKYERWVDSYLASPRYGERWAQPWLDLARYADSNGFQADQLRASWAYRDWVIQSINRDQPFDQFTVEQLAGDLLPGATLDQKIATGFHRTVTCNVEAGVHPEENRINQIFDRVNTTGAAFLGTTLECCQCHNHKYDPFTQDDYYRLFAFFNNTPLEVKLTSGVSYDFYGPKMELPLEREKVARRAELQAEIARLQQRKAGKKKAARGKLDELKTKLVAEMQKPVAWQALSVIDFQTSSGETHQVLADQSVLIAGSLPGTSRYQVTTLPGLARITAIRLDALTHESLPGTGPGRGDVKRPNFILSEFQVSLTQRDDGRDKPIMLANPVADFSQKGWEVVKAIDGDQKTGWAIAPQFFQDHWAVFPLQQPVSTDGSEAVLRFQLDQNYGRGRTLGRFRLSATSDDVVTLGIPEDIKKILLLQQTTPSQEKKLDTFLETQDPETVELTGQITALQKELDQNRPATTLVMQEMDQTRETFKLIRGNYLDPGKRVDPGVPAVLHPFDEQLPSNRLGFAKWLVDPANPLIARVAVNRWWGHFFGRGLMSSAEDFGTQSEPASHPGLLDWLAVELMEQGWSRKHVHKLIVMSATFRQSSRGNRESLQRDPDNRWIVRGPRFRLPAEMIRDNGLAISGLLSTKMGGPPVMPFQPPNLWRTVGRNGPKWKAAEDEDRFRRGVYIVWRRAAPYPSFVNFDAPDRAACVIERPRTNTPLQALTLLNDQAFLEMAAALAASVAGTTGSGQVRGQIRQALRRCVARDAEAEEIDILHELYRSELQRFQAEPKLAQKFLQECRAPAELSPGGPEHLAALTLVCNVLLNLDETINY
ncbi:MAG: PSD1 and planctomycete cytochrome C domain-containing protein [Mariniblastus sp.]|nr:PSD1 and planctomycete cytochrome C domain-containing protein [Mariniblastus sp.]